MTKTLLTLGILTFFSASCAENKITININSSYKGYVYLLSANLKSTTDIIEVDTNGIAYVPGYCEDEMTVNITVDHKKIERELSYVEDNEFYGNDFEVSYKTFYFPFYPRKRFDVEKERIESLVEQGKVDKTKLMRCERK
jgi:hypothetical protein